MSLQNRAKSSPFTLGLESVHAGGRNKSERAAVTKAGTQQAAERCRVFTAKRRLPDPDRLRVLPAGVHRLLLPLRRCARASLCMQHSRFAAATSQLWSCEA
eukprot:2074930-Pleurochrysis_carterae.AAC.1